MDFVYFMKEFVVRAGMLIIELIIQHLGVLSQRHVLSLNHMTLWP